MSMIYSMLQGRKQQQQHQHQPPPPPSPQQGQKAAANGRPGGGEGAGAVVEPVSIDILDPFMDAISLAAFTSGPAAALGMPLSSAAAGSMDWKETPTAHVFMADVPGLRREDVRVEVEEERVLRISGQRARAAEEKGDRWRRVERSAERFVRTVRLPPDAAAADAAGVHAALDNGVLTVTIPKDNDRKPSGRIIPIN